MNYKIFRNIHSVTGTRDWWKGVFGNILSTIIGILLTIGVGFLFQWHKDKKMSREMMFHVLMETEDDINSMETVDSLYRLQNEATSYFLELYNKYDHDLTKAKEDVPVDTLEKYLEHLFAPGSSNYIRNFTEKYFYNTQMMFQFDSPHLYSAFADYLELDLYAYNYMQKNHELFMRFYQAYNSKYLTEGKNGLQILNELIENHILTDYAVNLSLSRSMNISYQSKIRLRLLLRLMDATQEEYDEYKKEHNTDAIEEDVEKEIAHEDSINRHH